jgi:hypothetical protein
MKKVAYVFITLGLLLFIAIPAGISKTNVDGKGYVNNQDIDNATSPKAAISITNPTVSGSWLVNNRGTYPATFTRATIDYAGFLPNREFSFSETIKPGGNNKGSGSITLPEFVLGLKGFYNIRISGYDQSGDIAITRTFWISLGSGSPITGVVGGIGAALTAIALITGLMSAVKNGRWLRRISTALMIIAAPFILIAFGLVSTLQTAAFLGTTVVVGVADNMLIRLLTNSFGKK